MSACSRWSCSFPGNGLLANEFAPRVHNSGHWTIEGANTSQFENHLRAILDLPLGDTGMRGYAGMLNLIGNMPADATESKFEKHQGHLHDYGKATARPGRKLGPCDGRRRNSEATRAGTLQLKQLAEVYCARVGENRDPGSHFSSLVHGSQITVPPIAA